MVWLARDCKGKPPWSVLWPPYMQPHRAPAERSCGCADVCTYKKMGHYKDVLWPRLHHNCFVGRAGLRGVASSFLPGDFTSVLKKTDWTSRQTQAGIGHSACGIGLSIIPATAPLRTGADTYKTGSGAGKRSRAKPVNCLRSFGGKVVVCPTERLSHEHSAWHFGHFWILTHR